MKCVTPFRLCSILKISKHITAHNVNSGTFISAAESVNCADDGDRKFLLHKKDIPIPVVCEIIIILTP